MTRARQNLAALTALAVLGFAPALAAEASIGAGGDVLLQADEIVYDTDTSVVSARGNVEIAHQGSVLIAREVSYNQTTGVVAARGEVSLLQPNGDVAFADYVEITDDMRDGILVGFSALIGEHGRLGARRARRTDGRKTEAFRAAFTPCEICRERGERTPAWQVKAYHVVHDEVTRTVTYEDAFLEMFGVPVLYLPFFSHADPTVKRKSGLLTPNVGSSSDIGSFLELPYYVALSDRRDLTLAPLVTTEAGALLQGEYRDRWRNGGMWLQGSVAYNYDAQDVPVSDRWNSHIFGSGRLPITRTWQAGFDVELTSSDTYLKRYDITDRDRLTSSAFLEGILGRSRAAISGFFFQGLRATDDPAAIPYVAPRIEYSYVPDHHLMGGQFRFDLDAVALHRDEGVDSRRLSASMRWRLPVITDGGQVISFEASARGDVYHTDDANPLGLPGLPENSQWITRGLPQFAVDWRWPFVTSSRSGSGTFLVEPIVQLIAAPNGGNPDGIPNEDSTSFEFDETNLFGFTKFPGYDLWESGPRANIGVRVAAFFPSGSVEAVVGENIRLEDDPAFPPDSGLGDNRSDLVGRIRIEFPPYLNLTHRFRIDQDDGSMRRNEVYLSSALGRSSLKVGYVRLARETVGLGIDAREEINAEAAIGFFDHWSIFGAARRDLEGDQMIDMRFGLGYADECLGASIAYRRRYTRDRDLDPSASVILRIDLKTSSLGSLGD